MLDRVNACFELVAAVLVWRNVFVLFRTRQVSGVDWRVTGYWSAMGVWFCAYYWGVGHLFSLVAQAGIVLGNATWVVLAVRSEKR